LKYNRLSNYRIKKIIACFCEDLPATKTARILGVNRNTVNSYYLDFRRKIFLSFPGGKEKFSGEIELDESYFGARRVRGKRGRGAAGKAPVFGLLKRGGKVHVEVVKNCSRKALMPVIQGKILEGSTVYTDGWKAYDSLVLNGYDHYRVYHSRDEFARGKNHVNGIESFWSFCKRRLAKFNGIHGKHFLLHLKECELRWNHRKDNLEPIIWKIFKRY